MQRNLDYLLRARMEDEIRLVLTEQRRRKIVGMWPAEVKQKLCTPAHMMTAFVTRQRIGQRNNVPYRHYQLHLFREGWEAFQCLASSYAYDSYPKYGDPLLLSGMRLIDVCARDNCALIRTFHPDEKYDEQVIHL